jgi:hypothetical protein
MANLNGLELAGRAMKINHVTPEGGAGGMTMVPGAMEALDSEDFEGGGIGMTQQGRTQLMAKLAEGHNAGEEGGERCVKKEREREYFLLFGLKLM